MNNKAITNPQGRIICIGDLHGCIEEAYELLELCKPTSKDVVIFLGDLVDRGPEDDKCVDLVMKHKCILGNHEDRHLHYKDLEAQGKDPKVVVPNHIHHWQGPETIIFGHTVLNKPLITHKVVGIDGGAVFGGELWAYELPSKQIYKVKGKANYGKGFRGRSGQPIAAYLIHDDVETYS